MTADVKSIDIKNRTYFLSEMINLNNFNLKLLKINKKLYKDIDIYYIGYITIKKIDDHENIHSINPLYLIINSAAGLLLKKNDNKHLILNSGDKYEEVWCVI